MIKHNYLFLILLLPVLVLAGCGEQAVSQPNAVDAAIEEPGVDKPVVMEIDGEQIRYTAEEFNAISAELKSETGRLIFLESKHIGASEAYWLVFKSTQELIEYAERNGLEDELLGGE